MLQELSVIRNYTWRGSRGIATLQGIVPRMEPMPPLKLVLLMPVYNDWQCVRLQLAKLNEILALASLPGSVLLVDDGSSLSPPEPLLDFPLGAIETVECLRLRRNLGHQRAIAIGLCFIEQERDYEAVLVMDADGEDRPEDVPALVERFVSGAAKNVVFAERERRSESLTFRACYQIYRGLHRMLTGIPVKVGNFSILSRAHLDTLSVVSELWNHYAASVFKARLPVAFVPTARGHRLAGQSKLNFVSLVVHGLSAISVFAEIVGVRLILAIGIMVLLTAALVGVVVAVRLGTELAIPGWATSAVGLLLILVLQMLTLVVGLTFSVLFNRNSLTFLPTRDYRFFIKGVTNVHGKER
jgi:hypothetical protein